MEGISEKSTGIDALRIHVHGEGDDVAVARALAVAEEGAFGAVGARKEAELRRRDAVRGRCGDEGTKRRSHGTSCACACTRSAARRRAAWRFPPWRKVDDRLPLCRGLPDIEDGVDDFERVLGLGAREALGRIFEAVLLARLFGELLQKLRAVDGDSLDLFLRLFEDLLALGDGGRIIDVDDDVFAPLTASKVRRMMCSRACVSTWMVTSSGMRSCSMRARRNAIRLARGGEAHLDLLKADPKEQFEKFKLGFKRHGLDERLVAVAQIDAAPDGRF